MGRQTRFDADEVKIQEENGVLLVGFANGDGKYLLLQRTLSPSQQDKELGQDQVHLELNDQRYSTYGGISGYTTYSNRLILEIVPEGAARIGSQATLEVSFNIPENELRMLNEKLKELFVQDV